MTKREMVKLLKRFCADKRFDSRNYIYRPWSAGRYTYATNGHILVRVPRVAGIKENDKAPTRGANSLIRNHCSARFSEIPALPPPAETADSYWNPQYVDLRGARFQRRYLALIKSLPGGRLASRPPKSRGARFVFDGGVGVLMPMRKSPFRA